VWFRGPDGAGTLGKQNHAKGRSEFALTAIDNDLLSGPSPYCLNVGSGLTEASSRVSTHINVS
jgi:hypothetical protein